MLQRWCGLANVLTQNRAIRRKRLGEYSGLVEMFNNMLTGSHSHRLRAIGIVDQFKDRLGKCPEISRRDQQPSFAMHDNRSASWYVSRNRRLCTRACLNQRSWATLAVRGEYNQVSRVV